MLQHCVIYRTTGPAHNTRIARTPPTDMIILHAGCIFAYRETTEIAPTTADTCHKIMGAPDTSPCCAAPQNQVAVLRLCRQQIDPQISGHCETCVANENGRVSRLGAQPAPLHRTESPTSDSHCTQAHMTSSDLFSNRCMRNATPKGVTQHRQHTHTHTRTYAHTHTRARHYPSCL